MERGGTVLPVIEETLSIDKREVVADRVKVQTVTDFVEESISTDLEFTTVKIERVPIGQPVDHVPDVRIEGDRTIIPVIEEEAVVQRRLILREEIHVVRRRSLDTAVAAVTLRKQRAIVSRQLHPSSHTEDTTMTNLTADRRLSAFFDTRAEAEEAIARLRALGLTDANMRVTGGDEVSTRLESGEAGGFWDSISDFFFPTEEREAYAEGLRRGGFLVIVNSVPAERFDEAVDILDDEGSIDLDERSESWRAEGWQSGMGGISGSPERMGMSGVDPAARAVENESDIAALHREGLVSDSATGLTAPSGVSERDGPGLGSSRENFEPSREGRAGDEVIPVVEERLRVGKRDMTLGRVRVRSYVVEEPVSQDVSLRAEHVELERRPVDRAVQAGEEAFVDRTVEAEERAEEAVIQKEARVTEEIGLRKTSEERTETVSDTVRRTEVEIEDERESGMERRRDR